MNTSPASVNPLFFRLDVNSLAILSRLRYSEFKVYAYLRASDWFCNKQQDLDLSELLAVCCISKTSAYLALANLHAQGLIEWTHVRSNVRVKPLSSDDVISHGWESSPTHGNPVPPVGLDSHPREKRHLKVAHSKDSEDVRSIDQLDPLEEIKSNHDFSTDSDYIQWINQGLNALPKPPQGHFRDRMLQKAIDDPQNQKIFRGKKKAKKPIIATVEAIPSFPTNREFQQQQTQQRLDTLQAQWARGETSRVKAAVNAHPEWQVAIGAFGPQLIGDPDDGH